MNSFSTPFFVILSLRSGEAKLWQIAEMMGKEIKCALVEQGFVPGSCKTFRKGRKEGACRVTLKGFCPRSSFALHPRLGGNRSNCPDRLTSGRVRPKYPFHLAGFLSSE